MPDPDELLESLAQARNAYYEAVIVEHDTRARSIQLRLENKYSVTAAREWGEIDAQTALAEKLRNKAKMEALIDQRDLMLARIGRALDDPDPDANLDDGW